MLWAFRLLVPCVGLGSSVKDCANACHGACHRYRYRSLGGGGIENDYDKEIEKDWSSSRHEPEDRELGEKVEAYEKEMEEEEVDVEEIGRVNV